MDESEQYSRFVPRSSVKAEDIYCEPCQKVGQVATAIGYCVDCPEYLCRPCYKIHRQHKALANHVLIGKDSMPLATDSRGRVVEEICPIHPNKVIELFCETCDQLVCTICVATDHRQCETVKHIPDIVEDLEHTEEFKKFNEQIKVIADTLHEHKEKLKANVTSSNEMRTLAKQELKRQRAEVNSFFDNLEKKMDEQITAIEKRNKDILKAASDKLDHIKTELHLIKNDMEAKNKGQTCEMFMAMKRSQEKMLTINDQLNKIQRELRIQHYELVPSEQIQAMMRTTTEICCIATDIVESEIDIKTSTDKTAPLIQGLAITHGHYCVASDEGNKSIKVIDTESKCVTSKIAIKAENLFSVTSVSDDQVALAVSLSGDRNQIQFFAVSASGDIESTEQLFNFDDCYYDMVLCAGNIYGLMYDRIDRLNMTGKIIRTIYNDNTGISSMARIAASPDGQTLYVTDRQKDSVTSMTLNGKVKAVFKDKDLMDPVGITVDKHGYVYVCSHGSGNIHQLTADLNKVTVLTEHDLSYAITYSSTENRLYLNAENKIYSLDFK